MKKALLTTTALVALNGAAFASSIDTPVNSASSTHHTHSAATIVWSGDANIKYNVPLKATAGQSVDGGVASDVDLDVTMTSAGSYSATISAGIEGGAQEKLGPNATVTVTTPMFNVSVGTDDAAGGAAGGGGEKIFHESENAMAQAYTKSTNHNAVVPTPFTINATLTINSPSVVTFV